MKLSKYNLFCVAGAIISSSAISIILSMKTSNIMIPILAIILSCFYKYQPFDREKYPKAAVTACGVGGIWAFFMGLKALESFDRYQDIGAIGKIIIIACVFVGFFIFFSHVICFIYCRMDRIGVVLRKPEHKVASYQIFLLVFVGILVCWLPYYFMNYPGIVISDSCDQIGQAFTGVYSNHHPVIQTWMIQGVMNIGMQLFDNLNAAVALYCIFQMIILAAIYAYVIMTLYQLDIKKWFCTAVFAFYALVPYNVMFSFNMWKDSQFSAFVLLFTILMWKTIVKMKGQSTKIRVLDSILLLLSGLGICLFRNNGFYAFILLMPFFCMICFKKRKDMFITTIAVFFLTIFIKGPVFNYYQVASPDFVESLSIPAQQIARVVSDGLTITEEQTALLNQIVEVNRIAETYDPHISDPVKSLIRSNNNQEYLTEHKGEFLKLWLQIGIKYPFQYLRAYMNQTEGYWNPDVQYWVYADGVSKNQIGIYAEPLITENVGNKLEWFAWNSYESIPIYGIIWSIGTAVWVTILLAGFCYIRNKKKELCIFLPILGIWGTIMIATPVHAEFRYIYAIFLCMPVFIAAALRQDKETS